MVDLFSNRSLVFRMCQVMAGLTLVTNSWSQAEEFLISQQGTIETCFGQLLDSGDFGQYQPSEEYTVVICPPNPDSTLWLEWLFFDLDDASTIQIFDGDSDSAPLLDSGSGGELQGAVFQPSASNESGCLTVSFESGEGPESVGNFQAQINCGEPCFRPTPALVNEDDFPLRVCPGDAISFNAAASVAENGSTVAEYIWDWNEDFVPDVQGTSQTASTTFNVPGIFKARLKVVDDNGCESLDFVSYDIHVSTEPVWNLPWNEITKCSGDSVMVEVDIESETFVRPPDLSFGQGLFIPDPADPENNPTGEECFSIGWTFTEFEENAEVQELGDVAELLINFEHSYMGDLVISLTCPNGQTLMLHEQQGGPTFLGEPIDDIVGSEQGVGYDYSWSPFATNGTWVANSATVDTLPSGTYQATGDWADLAGCPINGTWELNICDFWDDDNGFIFDWGIEFGPDFYPAEYSFTPSFGLVCDSSFVTPELENNAVLNGSWNCPSVTFTNLDDAEQNLVLTTTNNFGCVYDTTVSVEFVHFIPILSASSEVLCQGDFVDLEVLTGELVAEFEYNWGPSDFLDSDAPNVTISDANGAENIWVEVTGNSVNNIDSLTCKKRLDVEIQSCEIVIPNVITPYLNEGSNDRFQPDGLDGYDDVQVWIYNRWGELMYTNDDFGNSSGWDPKSEGVSSGVYYYHLIVPVDEGPLIVTDGYAESAVYEGEGPFEFHGSLHVFD